jgi:hypothetical protein
MFDKRDARPAVRLAETRVSPAERVDLMLRSVSHDAPPAGLQIKGA